MAELPRPCRGIESSSPTSPQHISAMDMTEARLVPFLIPDFSSGFSSRRTPVAPAPSLAPDSASPSIIAASMSSSLGYSCSARSYLRDTGRSMFIATWCAWSRSVRNRFGSSRWIMLFGVPSALWKERAKRAEGATLWGEASDQHGSFHDAMARRSRYQRSTGCSLTKP